MARRRRRRGERASRTSTGSRSRHSPSTCARSPPTDLSTWDGELRSGARANVLMGVASNRVDVHQRRAPTPSAASSAAPSRCRRCCSRRGDYPAALLDIGWRKLILNSAHDSSCACSADDVVEAVRVRYQEARHVGEALTREAVRHARDHRRRAAVVDHRGEQHRRATAIGVVERPAARRRARCTSSRSTTAAPCPTQVVHTTTTDEGISTVVVGPEDPLGARDDARPRARRRTHRARRAARRSPTAPRSSRSTTRRRARPTSTSRRRKEQLLALGEAGATISIRQRRAPVRDVLVAHGRRARLRLAVVPTRWKATDRRTAVARRGTRARERARPRGGRRRRRHPDRRPADGITVAGLNRYVDGGDGGDTYNYSPPAVDTLVDRPESVDVTRRRVGSGAGRRGRDRHVLVARRARSATSDACSRAQRRTRRHRRRAPPRAAHRRAVPARARRARPPGARPPAARALPAARPRSTDPTPSARSRSCTAVSPPRAARTSSASPRSCPAGSSTARRDGDGRARAACTTGCSSTRSSDDGDRARAHARPRHRLPLPIGTARCGPTRRVRSTRSRAPSCRPRSRSTTRSSLHRGDVHAADLPAIGRRRAGAAGTRPRRRVAGGVGARRGSALDVDGAEVSALLRDDAGALVLRVVNRTPAAADSRGVA